MKILFISDIHGKITNLKYIDDLIIKENFDKIVREKIKKNVDMPEKINQLFLEFEKEVVNMEDYNKVNKKI